jgi:RimJ/RimL family protein N-acetyltransferase
MRWSDHNVSGYLVTERMLLRRFTAAAWGRGYATEEARVLVRHVFAGLGLDRVVATTMTVNVASRRDWCSGYQPSSRSLSSPMPK